MANEKPIHQLRYVTVKMKVTERERMLLEEIARLHGLGMSPYLRSLFLEDSTRVQQHEIQRRSS